MSQTSQIYISGLNRPINKNEKKNTKERQKAEEETQFSGVR